MHIISEHAHQVIQQSELFNTSSCRVDVENFPGLRQELSEVKSLSLLWPTSEPLNTSCLSRKSIFGYKSRVVFSRFLSLQERP